jgi:8-oxo-dGTP diphosphatase
MRNKLYNYGMIAARIPPLDEAKLTGSVKFLPNLEVRVVVFSLRDEQLQAVFSQSPMDSASWQLPGSRVPAEQSLEDTATDRQICLTGQHEAYLEQLYTYGEAAVRGEPAAQSGPSAQSEPEATERLVTVAYFAIIPAGAAYAHGSSIDKDGCPAKWFPVGQLPRLVHNHADIMDYALRRLRYKLEYTAVGFQLMPEQFSLSELQKVYEMILGERLDKRNFRRRILQAGIIEETRQLRSGEGRPARLFRYRPDAVAEVKARRLFP